MSDGRARDVRRAIWPTMMGENFFETLFVFFAFGVFVGTGSVITGWVLTR